MTKLVDVEDTLGDVIALLEAIDLGLAGADIEDCEQQEGLRALARLTRDTAKAAHKLLSEGRQAST